MQEARSVKTSSNVTIKRPLDTPETDHKPKLMDRLRESFALAITAAARSRLIVIGSSGASFSTRFVILRKWLSRKSMPSSPISP